MSKAAIFPPLRDLLKDQANTLARFIFRPSTRHISKNKSIQLALFFPDRLPTRVVEKTFNTNL
ncbi:hypothetical protein Hanom_Chr09g00771261 [Helianthus anomalus]